MITELYINRALRLIRFNENWWSLIGTNSREGYMLQQFSTFTLKDNNKDLYAYDPPGGPYMQVGGVIRYDDSLHFEIEEIKLIRRFCILFRLKEIKTS